MTTMKWHTRAIYILIALAVAIGLTGIAATPEVSADPGLTKWTKVTTPSETDKVILPKGNFILWGTGCTNGFETLGQTLYTVGTVGGDNLLLKSTDSGASWSDKTSKLTKCISDEGLGELAQFNYISVALDDADFLAVAAYVGDRDGEEWYNLRQQVFVSDDGATTFAWPGDLIDLSTPSKCTDIFSMAISTEVDGKRNIAAGGINDPDGSQLLQDITRDGNEIGVVYRLETGGLFGAWHDATNPCTYQGWNDGEDWLLDDGCDDWWPFVSTAVTTVAFAPSWEADRTVLVTTHTNVANPNPLVVADAGDTYLQSGTWGTTKAWNAEAGFPDAVSIVENVPVLWPFARAFITGIAMPFDYEGRHSSKRYSWVYVDYLDLDYWEFGPPEKVWIGEIFRVVNSSAQPLEQQVVDMPWMATFSYWGTIESGKAIVGLIGDGAGYWEGDLDPLAMFTACCDGVQVYRNDNIEDMEVCCAAWKAACKPPTGQYAVVLGFISADKAYATSGVHPYYVHEYTGIDLYDESSFSFTLDDGDNWNQVSLTDTYIDYLSDVAVSPSCDTTYLASVNLGSGCGCDSVWFKADDLSEAEEYSGVWLRVWCKYLEGWEYLDWEAGLLRLAPEETDETLTVYLVDRGSDNVWYNGSKGLTCWEKGHSTVDFIGDLAVLSESTIYALSMVDGDVAVSDDHGATATWESVVDSGVEFGHTIAVDGDYVLVGGLNGEAAYSDDNAGTFNDLDDIGSGNVHVAFDSYFDDNGTVYAAVGDGTNGIYRCSDLEGGEWTDLNALPYDYTGIVLDNADGNPMTDAEHGGVLYASADDISKYYYPYSYNYSGVARCLTPAEEVCCGEASWDYLVEKRADTISLDFTLEPSALKICGCLTEDTNSRLWAIDDRSWPTGYDIEKADRGTLWEYEDCFAKAAPALVNPADDAMVPADPCYCWNDAFVLKWDRQCNACSYDIQISLDDGFTEIVEKWTDEWPPSGANPSLVIENNELGSGSCGTTFYWRVRSADAETDELIHSFWSEVRTFTVAQGPAAAITLTAPENGATNVPVSGVSFTWSSVASATTYDFTLSASADLSSPIVTETGLTGTAYTYTGTLSEETPYYWQVNALKDGKVISSSDLSTFTTTPPAPPPPPEPVTPAWVWVVIGLGAVLVIVVIVLIFRTRRV